jgi:hypothetical protein
MFPTAAGRVNIPSYWRDGAWRLRCSTAISSGGSPTPSPPPPLCFSLQSFVTTFNENGLPRHDAEYQASGWALLG